MHGHISLSIVWALVIQYTVLYLYIIFDLYHFSTFCNSDQKEHIRASPDLLYESIYISKIQPYTFVPPECPSF